MLARLIRGLPGRGPRKGQAGFTLIELMIVIAVIMILAAILLPQFAIARERAKKASCVSNQRNIETAVSMWATDNPMPVYVGGTFNVATPGFTAVTGAGGGIQYSLAGAFIEPDHNGIPNNGADYYLSNGSASGAVGSAAPSAPSYGHVACAYDGVSDPWVASYDTANSSMAGINHTRGPAASP